MGHINQVGGDRDQIGTCGFTPEKINGRRRDKSCTWGISISRTIGGGLRVASSSYAGEIQDAPRGFDAARFVKIALLPGGRC